MMCILSRGCIPNSDSVEELSGDYFYRDEGSHTKDILSHSPNHQEIYSEVIDYSYDSDFIVVLQRPISSEYKVMIGFNLSNNSKKYSKNTKEDILKSEANSILVHDDYYKSVFKNKVNYWIISHTKQKLYGPFTRDEYEKNVVI